MAVSHVKTDGVGVGDCVEAVLVVVVVGLGELLLAAVLLLTALVELEMLDVSVVLLDLVVIEREGTKT